ncbi:MAG: GntR family transcriptional regulator [Pseudomonadota bacterium]
MKVSLKPDPSKSLAPQIAEAIRTAILDGTLRVDTRLPSETDLAQQFDVSRPTIREALKRLAAQNLIRTTRGVTGGAFVNRMSWAEAEDEMVTQTTLMLTLHSVDFETASAGRFALERAALPLALQNRTERDIESLGGDIARQKDPALTDEQFCASDVAFHRRLIAAGRNPLLTLSASAAVSAMQPLMNMLTYKARDRAEIARFHARLLDALITRDRTAAETILSEIEHYGISMLR